MTTPNETTAITYEQSGVNINAGEQLVERIKPLARSTFGPRVLTELGGFGGLFDARFPEYKHPVLVASTDGVGTKIRVAIEAGRHNTVGADLVNHCTNDILVCGATPLFFLDYFATGRLDVEIGEAIVSGFASACKENGCALIGGETAEMPGIYHGDDYDLAGTIVGVVDRDKMFNRDHVEPGDVLLGLRSVGLHTNGFSLARPALFPAYSLNDRPAELGGETIADALLKVHRSYLRPISTLLKEFNVGADVRAISHITGGGIIGNTTRVIPKDASLRIEWDAWNWLPIFDLIQQSGNVPEEDMRRTFNLGIGLVLIVQKSKVERITSALKQLGEDPVRIGEVV